MHLAHPFTSALTLGLGGMVGAAQAAEIHWIGGDAGDETNFNSANNWDGSSLPAFYDESLGAVNGDIAVFDGTILGGVDNKTPTMTADFGDGANQSAQWGLLGVKFVDSGWTLDTGSNTLFISRQDAADLRSEAANGTNTVNGNVRMGARDTNEFSDIYVETGGTLRINGTLGVAIDGGGNTSGSINKTGAGLLELNTTNAYRMRIVEGTVRLVDDNGGGINGNGTGGVGTNNNITVAVEGGTLDVNGVRSSLGIGTLVLTSGELTNSAATIETITTRPTSNQTLAGLISGNLHMVFGANATNTTTITNDNTYTGDTTIANSSGGGGTNTVVVTSNNPFGTATSAIQLGSSGNSSPDAALLTGAAVTIDRDIILGASTNSSSDATLGAHGSQVGDSTFSGNITVGTGVGGAKLAVTAPTAVAVHFSGNIVEHGNAALGVITKEGEGTVRFTGDNTYAGGTTVSEGLLLVDNATGSGTGDGAVNVLLDALLGGDGSIAGDVDFSTGGTFLAQALATLNIDGLISAAGGIIATDDTLTLASYTVLTHGVGNLIGVFTVDDSIISQGYSVVYDDTSVSLVIPEPASLALALLGGVMLIRRGRNA